MKKRNIAIMFLPALAAGLCGCHKSDADKNAVAEIAHVSVARPLVRPITVSESYPATLTAADEVEVVARVSGRLLSAPYTPGAVKKGTVLFEIEKTDYLDAFNKAQASLESALAQREYAATHLEALQKALQADAVSRMEVEQAQSNLQQIEADIKTARAGLEDARTQLDYCTIRAPFDCRVTSNALDPGTILTAGAKLASIYNEEHFTAEFNIPEEIYLQLMAQTGGNPMGVEMTVNFAGELPHAYTAKLSYVSPNVDTGTGTYVIHGRVENPWGELRSGMYATIELPLRHEADALLVFGASLGSDQRGNYLYTIAPDSTVTYTHVETGSAIDDTLRVITSGIDSTTVYVTKALLKVRPGEKVSPVFTNRSEK